MTRFMFKKARHELVTLKRLPSVIFGVIVMWIMISPVAAHNNVVVIPLSGDDIQPLANIVTVAKQNGDFSDPISAMNSIFDSGRDNPYLIVIAPGVYTMSESLKIRPYVSIVGSGSSTTIIRGSVSGDSLNGDSALIDYGVAGEITISDITLENSSRDKNHSVGIYNTSILKLNNVSVKLQDGINQVGVYSTRPFDGIEIRDSEIEVSDSVVSGVGMQGPFEIFDSTVRVRGTLPVAFKINSFNNPFYMDGVAAFSGNNAENTLFDVSGISAQSGFQFITNSRILGRVIGSNIQCSGVFLVFSSGALPSDDACQLQN